MLRSLLLVPACSPRLAQARVREMAPTNCSKARFVALGLIDRSPTEHLCLDTISLSLRTTIEIMLPALHASGKLLPRPLPIAAIALQTIRHPL